MRFRSPVEEPVAPGVKLGARVKHSKFGEGVVLNVEGSGAHARVEVRFEARRHQGAHGSVREPGAGAVTPPNL